MYLWIKWLHCGITSVRVVAVVHCERNTYCIGAIMQCVHCVLIRMH